MQAILAREIRLYQTGANGSRGALLRLWKAEDGRYAADIDGKIVGVDDEFYAAMGIGLDNFYNEEREK